MSTPRVPVWLRWAVVVVAAAVIFVSSVDTMPAGTPVMGPLGLVGFDKWLHTLAYGGLGGLLVFALVESKPTRRAVLFAVCIAAAYGIGIELVQGFIPYRALDPTDAVANGFGALLGSVTTLAALLAWRTWNRSTPRESRRAN